MTPIAVIDAPSVLGLFPRGVERLPAALHAHGLLGRIGAAEHHHVPAPPHSAVRDPDTGLNNAAAMVSYAEQLAAVVGDVMDRQVFPLVLGGDCSIVFGPLLALAQRGSSGLLFLDGHADFAHPDDEPSGEAASMDLALATGRGPAGFGPIGGRRRLIADEHVAVLGYRVHDDGTDTCSGTPITDTAITTIGLDELRGRPLGESVASALGVVAAQSLDGFWTHIDADVLDDAVMPAVDYRNPGGLSWDELTEVVRLAIASGAARGLDLTIFNPSLDPDGQIAERLVQFLADVLA
jgi:arginase